VENGTDSISAAFTAGWAALSLDSSTALNTAGYSAIKFWVNGGSTSKPLQFYSQMGDTSGNSTNVPFTAPANAWTEITIPLSSLGNPTTIKRINFQDTSNSAQSATYFDDIRLVPINPTPFVAAGIVNGGAAQRSMVTNLSVVFSKSVTLAAGAFTLLNRAGAVVPGVTLNATSTDQITWNITFSGLGLQSGSLPDGAYRLRVSASAVQDSASQNMAADYKLRFFRLFGDSNGDRMVDRTDLAAFRAALAGSYVSYFDLDGDGVVTMSDYTQFRRRLIKRFI
jgi:hypothetical protein